MKIFDMQCVLHDQGSGHSCPAEGLIEVNVSENQARQLSVLVVGWEASSLPFIVFGGGRDQWSPSGLGGGA